MASPFDGATASVDVRPGVGPSDLGRIDRDRRSPNVEGLKLPPSFTPYFLVGAVLVVGATVAAIAFVPALKSIFSSAWAHIKQLFERVEKTKKTVDSVADSALSIVGSAGKVLGGLAWFLDFLITGLSQPARPFGGHPLLVRRVPALDEALATLRKNNVLRGTDVLVTANGATDGIYDAYTINGTGITISAIGGLEPPGHIVAFPTVQFRSFLMKYPLLEGVAQVPGDALAPALQRYLTALHESYTTGSLDGSTRMGGEPFGVSLAALLDYRLVAYAQTMLKGVPCLSIIIEPPQATDRGIAGNQALIGIGFTPVRRSK